MNDTFLRFYTFVLNLLREYFGMVFIYAILISVLTLATPISVQSVVNTFALGPYLQPLIILSVLLFVLLLFLGLVKSLQYLLVEYMQRQIIAKISSAMIHGYTYKESKDVNTLTMANRFFEIMLIQKSLAYLVTDLIAVLLQTVIGLVLISLYHPFFIFLGIITVVSAFSFVYLIGRYGLQTAVDESSAKHRLAEYIESLVLRSERIEKDKAISEGDRQITDYLENRKSHFYYLFTQNILFMILYAFLNAILLGLGGFLVIRGQLSVGQLVAAEIVLNGILYHFLYAKKYLEAFYDLFASTEKVKVFYPELYPKAYPGIKRDKNFLSKFPSFKSVYAPTQTPHLIKKTMGVILIVLILLMTVPWRQTSHGRGKVIALNPNDRAQFITATVSGRVEKWLVTDGEHVEEGQPIVRVVDNDPNFMERLETRKDAAEKKFISAKVARETARFNYDRQKQLMNEGLTSRKDFEKAKITFQKMVAEEAAYAADLAKAETDLSRQSLQTIVAPRSGRVLRILVGSGTVNVKEGEKLIEFVPDTDNLAVELFIDGNDLPLIFKGRKVRVQFEGWPAIQFSGWPSVAIGSFAGVVYAVDPSVAEDGQFRILVTPDLSENAEIWPDKAFLRQGSQGIGMVLLDTVSIGYEFWRQSNGFPKSLNESPSGKYLKVKRIKAL
jgi:biotin carboxyl carrier protein